MVIGDAGRTLRLRATARFQAPPFNAVRIGAPVKPG
jgi:hypothetical protein